MQWKMMGKQSRGGKMPENKIFLNNIIITCVEFIFLYYLFFIFFLILSMTTKTI